MTIDAENGQQRGSVFASTAFSCSGEAQSSLRMGLGRAGVLQASTAKRKRNKGDYDGGPQVRRKRGSERDEKQKKVVESLDDEWPWRGSNNFWRSD